MTPSQRGWEDFHKGVMISACPFDSATAKKMWLNGWHRASKGYNKPQPEFKQ